VNKNEKIKNIKRKLKLKEKYTKRGKSTNSKVKKDG
jgi:hypothetical protein